MSAREKADELFDLATAEHARAYAAAKLIEDESARQEAFRKADSTYEAQREYQCKVRHSGG